MNELYFIPILVRALDSLNPSKALEEAFTQIVSLGQQEQYREGYINFRTFMDHAVRWEEIQAQRGLITSDADGLAEVLGVESVEPSAPTRRVFIMERDGQPFGQIELDPGGESSPLENLTPGHYTLKLPMTGRLVWEKTVEPYEVLIGAGDADTWLEMAAATEEEEVPPSIEAPLLGGQMMLRIYPGVRGAQAIISERR